MNTMNTAKKYEISEAICKTSGLKFRWVEESIKGLDYRLELDIHPAFKKENFLKVEGRLLGKKFYEMDKVLASGLIMYRLMDWGVITPKPNKEVLNAWVECMGKELSIVSIQKYYRLVLENYGNEGGFKISLDGIVEIRDNLNENETREDKEKREGKKEIISAEVKQLCFLIDKCEEEHVELVEKGRRLSEEEEIEEIVKEDIKERKVQSIDKEYLTQKAVSAMKNLYRNIDWEEVCKKDKGKEKGLKGKWRSVTNMIEEEMIKIMDSDKQEKVLMFIEKGMKKSKKSPGKPEQYLSMYIAWIRSDEGDTEDWSDYESMEDEIEE